MNAQIWGWYWSSHFNSKKAHEPKCQDIYFSGNNAGVFISVIFAPVLHFLSHRLFSSNSLHPALLQTTILLFHPRPWNTHTNYRLLILIPSLIQKVLDMLARRCSGAFVCMSDGSVSGQEWALAAGFLLMNTPSIYLLWISLCRNGSF